MDVLHISTKHNKARSLFIFVFLPPCPQIRPLKVFDCVYSYGIKKMWELYSSTTRPTIRGSSIPMQLNEQA